jgi:hypothetical protein
MTMTVLARRGRASRAVERPAARTPSAERARLRAGTGGLVGDTITGTAAVASGPAADVREGGETCRVGLPVPGAAGARPQRVMTAEHGGD